MVSVGLTSFSSPTHAYGDWALVRQQLATAKLARVTGETPPLAVLACELNAIAEMFLSDGRLPYTGGAQATALASLTADWNDALLRIGQRTRERVMSVLRQTPPFESCQGVDPAWCALLAHGQALYAVLGDGDSVYDALRDALDAAASADPLETRIVALRPLLDHLRGVAEVRSRASWKSTMSLIQQYLTTRTTDEEGYHLGGKFEDGTSEEAVLSALRIALAKGVSDQRWAVWFATRAGPGGHEHRWPSIVGGCLAVSGVTCVGGVDDWLEDVRDDLAGAYQRADLPVPPDVTALGEPQRHRGEVVLAAAQLWSVAQSTPCFLARIDVVAPTHVEAAELARIALRESLAARDPRLARDILADAILWSERSGWFRPKVTARGSGFGELFAPRTAADAVHQFGSDLGTPLDPAKLELLRSRTLVRNGDVSFEVRLARAWSELEYLARPSDLPSVSGRLWVATAWQHLGDVVQGLARQVTPIDIGPLATGYDYEQLERALSEVEASGPTRSVGEWLDRIRPVVDLVHPQSLFAGLYRAVTALADSPDALAEWKANHAAAFQRAKRQRNLAVHGYRVPDLVLAPTVAFLTRQLEVAIAGHDADMRSTRWQWLGSLATNPSPSWSERTPRQLDDAVASGTEPRTPRQAS